MPRCRGETSTQEIKHIKTYLTLLEPHIHHKVSRKHPFFQSALFRVLRGLRDLDKDGKVAQKERKANAKAAKVINVEKGIR